jgi:PHD finger-like domain-containing protein 5A
MLLKSCCPSGDGKCPICDSYVRPATLVRICDECNYGSYEGRCVICGGQGISDAYYCKECTLQEKDVRHSLCLRLLSTPLGQGLL